MLPARDTILDRLAEIPRHFPLFSNSLFSREAATPLNERRAADQTPTLQSLNSFGTEEKERGNKAPREDRSMSADLCDVYFLHVVFHFSSGD
jgi:hypothetical protein